MIAIMKKLIILMSIVSIVLLCSCAGLQIVPQFTVSKPVVCLTQPEAYRVYQANEDKQCLRSFPIWFYMEFRHVTVKEDDTGKHCWMDFYSQIIDFKGNVIFENEYLDVKIYLQQICGTEDLNKVWTWYVISPAHPSLNMYAGEYTVKFKLRDCYADVTSETSVDFIIVDGRDI